MATIVTNPSDPQTAMKNDSTEDMTRVEAQTLESGAEARPVAAGRVLKVTGAIRGVHRKRVCVALSAERASLATATP